ncbi:MAG: 4Fe-4S dicluster domain-containing protein [Chloroflexota bacterium]
MSHTEAIRAKAKQLLESGEVECVLGYEVGPRGRVRPAFIHSADEAARLVWNRGCTHNLAAYLPGALRLARAGAPKKRMAVVVKPCDCRAINMLLAENQFARDQVHLVGVVCGGIARGAGSRVVGDDTPLQARCQACSERTPILYDTRIGEPPALPAQAVTDDSLARMDAMTPAERAQFWLRQFDRCLRCYACRQACPMCNCPTCLYERDDSLWVGMGIGLSEKRAFHLGRAYHLAGRCVGCNECERVCPVGIPISLLNIRLAREVEAAFGFRPGLEPKPSPLVTVLGDGEVAA